MPTTLSHCVVLFTSFIYLVLITFSPQGLYQPGPSVAPIVAMPFTGRRAALYMAPERVESQPCDSDLSCIHTASCQDMSCNKQGECIETIGNYTCSCYPGFYGPECEYGEAGTWVVLLWQLILCER